LIYVTLKKGKKVSYNRYPKIKNPHQYADKGFNVGVEGFEPPTPLVVKNYKDFQMIY